MRFEEESKVSQRGSVVIPKLFRRILKVEQGDTVIWIAENGTVTVKKKEAK
jgi:bifunctional DNA-binding transcriptional regulator/antitoxin component of YhaV-PrlF toxin-antitoxin module